MMKSSETSWNRVADWYGQLLGGEGTYQKDLILPNLMRLMDLQRGDMVLDLACGPGFFSREFALRGAKVVGVDASQKLIDTARADMREKKGASGSGDDDSNMRFFVSRADKIPFVKDETIDKAAIVLALQNIENVGAVLGECARVIRHGGKLYLVLNHPAFRVPKASSWGWDAEAKAQYRRIDRYLSELKTEIDMHPGAKRANGVAHRSEQTISFHRPFQYYFKALAKSGFMVAGLEEWNSHRASEPGPRAKAENLARKEIPLFMCLIAERK